MPEEALYVFFSTFAVLFLAYGVFRSFRKVAIGRSVDTAFLRVMLPRKDGDQDERKETARDFKEWIGIMEQFLVSLKGLSEGTLREKIFGADAISFEYLAEK